jgi:hypothetical protein
MKRKAKSMLIIFFDIEGIVLKEPVLAGQTINSAYYCDSYGECFNMCEEFASKLWLQKNSLLRHETHRLTLLFSPVNFFFLPKAT